ncbi:MAG: circularly permuted type 2 ATP-grasp protein, partial [Pirellulaceae bacterium]
RDVHGQWHVLADRTQGPSGAGYSVENRIAISGVLPDEFRDMLVQRSAPFFAALRDSMNRHAIPCEELALMVLLSPGVHSSAYFEDAYLARYLGYTLAQSQDLTVRGGRVFLKTLAGLKRVSNILRRVPDLE